MKVINIEIKNYRLLKNFSIDLENNLSLVIGKNNCGKTSFLSVLQKFFYPESSSFSFNDINLDHQTTIKEFIFSQNLGEDLFLGIVCNIIVKYSDDDDLSNVSRFILNLDPDSHTVVVGFQYCLDIEKITQLRNNYQQFKTKYQDDDKKDIIYFLKKKHADYFELQRKAIEFENRDNSLPVDRKDINKLLAFKYIHAKRGVRNSESSKIGKADKTLSKLSSEYYDKISDGDTNSEHAEDLRVSLNETDIKLNEIYKGLFERVVSKVKRFGGINSDESIIQVISQLEEKNILKENTSVIYNHDNRSLPEDYNGLGYMNLIAMIFEIEVVINDFKKKQLNSERPADINVFFIEEPEAHTHPQMQYIFIKNIKDILSEEAHGSDDGVPINLQTIISTHSPYITAESNFDDVKYFHRESENSVIAKNLTSLKDNYELDPKHYKFLKQYLTLTKAELFFADKAVLIEGDTERILLPTMMKKIDIEQANSSLPHDELPVPLISQNISTVEVGAYSQIFEKFIDFLGIKSLIITDFDTVDSEGKACNVNDGINVSNSAISFFFGADATKATLASARLDEKCFSKVASGEWVINKEGNLLIAYQIEENDYHARSFEDAFLHVNIDYIVSNCDEMKGVKNSRYLKSEKVSDPYFLALNCIAKKTHFALDIIYFSDEDYSNWTIPKYIKDGLLWLQK